MNNQQIEEMLIKNDALFGHLYVINQEFDIIPNNKHYGMAINYIDLQESRTQFIKELINTILDWVYSKAKQANIIEKLRAEGRSKGNSYSELLGTAFAKFRPATDGRLLHGQFGELLLSNCIQRFFHAVPILRKMPITTSSKHERFGSDAIHYKRVDDNNLIFLGEAKSYTSDYQFNKAFEDAIISILDVYYNISKELRLYIHEDFLESGLQEVATDFLNGKLKNVNINLISIIAYNETNKLKIDSEEQIKANIKKIICARFLGFNKSKIDLDKHKILSRITYIVFPIWEFDDLLNEFAQQIKN